MALDLKVYDRKIYLSTNSKHDMYEAIRFLAREVEKMEIRDKNEVTIYDFREKQI